MRGDGNMKKSEKFEIVDGVLKQYNGSDKDVVIPNGVTSIGDNAFRYCEKLTSVEIPEGVISIGARAFQLCSKLKSVVIPQSVRSIGVEAFKLCSKLTNVEIPEGVTYIGEGAFYGCGILERKDLIDEKGFGIFWKILFAYHGKEKNVQIPEGIMIIEKYAFGECESIESIDIPNSVIGIGEYAFGGCRSLREIVIPEGVTEIKKGVFARCSCLEKIDIPNSVIAIGEFAFSSCSSLREMVIPEGVKEIEEGVLAGCSCLESIDIPNGVISIGVHAFNDCNSLREIVVPEGVKKINAGVFENCSALRKIVLSEGLTEIEEHAFKGCVSLSEMTIPVSVNKLKKSAFEDVNGIIVSKYIHRIIEAGKKPDVKLADYFDGDLIDASKIIIMCAAKRWQEVVISHIDSEKTEELIKCLIETIEKLSTMDIEEVQRVVKFVITNLPNASKEVVDMLIEKIKNKGGDVSEIEESDLYICKIEKKHIDKSDDNEHPIEKYVRENYVYDPRMLDIINAVNVGVSYADKSGICSKEAIVLLIYSYAEKYIENRHISEYKDGMAKCEISNVSDNISEALDRNELIELLKALAFKYKKYYFLPFGRYADEESIVDLLSNMKKWESWNTYFANGRLDILDARAGVALSDTKTAILHFDKIKKLDVYANLHNTNEDYLRNVVLTDAGIDCDNKIEYDLGGTKIIVTLQSDLSLSLFDTAKNKVVKSIPKAGNDEQKVTEASKDFSNMKKNVKKIVKTCTERLYELFLSGEEYDVKQWKEIYLENEIWLCCARLIVWQQNDSTFIVKGKDAICLDGTPYLFTESPIKVAHPMEMKREDVLAWQKYFITNGLKQPFTQIWEPVINKSEIKSKRYEDCMIPFYRFRNQEKQGIIVGRDGIMNDIDDVDIYFKDCIVEIERIDWNKYGIKNDDRFVILSFKVENFTRMSNHIVSYLDKILVYNKIENDDVSVKEVLSLFTLAQISDFIKKANENKSVNVLAMLMEYKNNNFSDIDLMDEFTLLDL